MKRLFVVLALSGVAAVPAFATDEGPDLGCSDFMSMEAAERTQAMEQMGLSMEDMEASTNSETAGMLSADDLGGNDGRHSGVMGIDTLVADAEEACSAHSDATVSEALEMMADG